MKKVRFIKKFHNKYKDTAYLVYRWMINIFDPYKILKSPLGYFRYFKDWNRYSKIDGAESIEIINTYPCIHDNIGTTPFDSHYFYQDIWAFKRILKCGVDHHVDVGSKIDYIGFLTAITHVTFIDIRPLNAQLTNFESKKGNILSMPYSDESIKSISCLHVAEHIGLGRYGDPIDPSGTKKAAKELSKILAKNGNLFFSLPIGKPRLCFHAHRIHSTQQILEYFSDLELIELSGINDHGKFISNIDSNELDSCDYGCGLFWFKKK